ncbi:CoA pyrophosphatase [Flavobacterium sp.]|uniref:NUDIX hydrolase n=1 Tax=Flavobacterium sp. TaxID=239 RepID=UPI00286BB3B4|nr:CoA pyrophosphatase [Flavobacterium sp.]
MDFQDFLYCIPKLEREPLPAEAAHNIMTPPERKQIMKDLDLEAKNPRKAAVMMLFYPKDSQTHLVLIQRNTYPGVHSSQIAFPGGKVELEDETLTHTALRETHEEIGIIPDQIQVVRAFSEVYIPPSNFMVYPFLGLSQNELSFNPDPEEVAGIIELPLLHFLDENNVVSQRMDTAYSKSIDVPAFKIQEHYVWGATAMMLSELKETLKKVL